MKKIIGLGIVIVILLLALPRLTASFNKATQTPKKTLTGLDIAKQTMTFLDKTAKPQGGFYNAFECDEKFEGICRPRGIYSTGHAYAKPPPHFGHLILAFYDLGKKTNDAKLKEKADTAMTFILSSCDKDTDYCLWNFSPLIVYYNDTKDISYKNAMLKVTDELLKEKPLIDYLALNSGLKLRALYDVTHDERYLSLLRKNADAIMAGKLDQDDINPIIYKEGDFALRAQTYKAIWSEIMPLYNETKDQKYLSYAKESLEKGNIIKHMGSLQNTDELQLLIFVLEIRLQLATLDSGSKDAHLAQAHDIAQYIYKTYADTPENKKYNADFGFVNSGIKDSLNNGWLVRHFIKLSDDTFSSN